MVHLRATWLDGVNLRLQSYDMRRLCWNVARGVSYNPAVMPPASALFASRIHLEFRVEGIALALATLIWHEGR